VTGRSLALLCGILAPASIVAATWFGSVDLGAQRWIDALMLRGDPVANEILWRLRLPRALAAFVDGGLLALSGVLLQSLLRNPLADPYVAGISGGVAVGGLGAMALGLGTAGVHAFGLAGALAVVGVIGTFASRASGFDVHRVLLAGVGIASGCGAAVSLILALAPAAQVHGLLFWLMGDLSGATMPWTGAAALLIVGVAAWLAARNLDILALGATKALALGVPVRRTQAIAFLGASLATMVAVLDAGAIGFVGLAVPHLLRLLGAHAHRWLIPSSIAGGGILLTIADTLARTVAAPIEVPVGVATAAIGVPTLLWLVARTR